MPYGYFIPDIFAGLFTGFNLYDILHVNKENRHFKNGYNELQYLTIMYGGE